MTCCVFKSHFRNNAHMAITHAQQVANCLVSVAKHPCCCVVQRRETCLDLCLQAFFGQSFEHVLWKTLLFVCSLCAAPRAHQVRSKCLFWLFLRVIAQPVVILCDDAMHRPSHPRLAVGTHFSYLLPAETSCTASNIREYKL